MAARIFGALGQAAPGAALTDLYTVPAARRASVKVVLSNTGAGAATARLSLAKAGAANATKQYILWNEALAVDETKSVEAITLAATDVLRGYASTADVAINVIGIEEDAT